MKGLFKLYLLKIVEPELLTSSYIEWFIACAEKYVCTCKREKIPTFLLNLVFYYNYEQEKGNDLV